MKKFRGVIDGIRQTVNSSKPDASLDVEESLKSDKFQIVKTVRHGFPHAPSCVAYDPLQRLIAIGTKFGVVCVLGRPGVDMFITHENEPVVLQIHFVINDGSLITVCSDQTLSHWSFRQKKPELLHSLQFNREGLSYCYMPYQSKWMYCGTDKGNVYMMQLDKFELSGYVINWNKAMELSRRTHPGSVVHISDNYQQPNNILIGFDAGLVVLWDLKAKTAIARFSASTPIHTVSWFSDARSFVCGHVDGSLSTWNCKQPQRPVSIVYPHGQLPNGGHEECRPVMKVEWLSCKNGDAFTVFTGGMPLDRMTGRMPCLSISRGKSVTVLEMEHNIMDFVCMCETPYTHDAQEPYAVVVLLQNDLVVIDLTTTGYPCFENPYAMDVHDAAVTCCYLLSDCPADLIPAFYSIGRRTKTNTTGSSNVTSADQGSLSAPQNGANAGTGVGASIGNTVMSILNTATSAVDSATSASTSGAAAASDGQQPANTNRYSTFSGKSWPITGGNWGNAISSYQTLIITGHADGALKFWDASASNFQILYKLKTNKIFDRVRRRGRGTTTTSAPNVPTPSSATAPSSSAGVGGESAEPSGNNSTSSSSTVPHGNAAQTGIGTSSLAKTAVQNDDPFAIHSVSLCTDSRRLAVTGQSHIVLFAFSRRELVSDVPSVLVSINRDVTDDVDGAAMSMPNSGNSNESSGLPPSSVEPARTVLHVKQGQRKWPVGYQPELVALVAAHGDNEQPLSIIATALNTHYGLLAVGTEHGVGIIDYIQRVCVASLATADLYGSLDPYTRVKPKGGAKLEDSTGKGGEQQLRLTIPPRVKWPAAEDNEKTYPNHIVSPVVEVSPEADLDHSEVCVSLSQSGAMSPDVVTTSFEVSIEAFPKFDSGVQSDAASFTKGNKSVGFAFISDSSSDQSCQSPGIQAPELKLDEKSDYRKSASVNRAKSMPGHLKPIQTNKKKFKKRYDNPVEETQASEVSNVETSVEVTRTSELSEDSGKLTASSNLSRSNRSNSPVRAQSSVESDEVATSMPAKSFSSSLRWLRESLRIKKKNDPEKDKHSPNHLQLPPLSLAPAGKENQEASSSSSQLKVSDCESGTPSFGKPSALKCDVLFLLDLSAEIDHSNTSIKSGSPHRIRERILRERAAELNPHAHSSSTSSLDVVSQEVIQTLSFYDSFARRAESSLSPCLYVGTSLGSVIVLSVHLPEARSTQPVMVSPNNTVIRLKGSIICVQLLDFRGYVLQGPSERWEEARAGSSLSSADKDREASSVSTSGYASGSGSTGGSGSTTERRERFHHARATTQPVGSPSGSTGEGHQQVSVCSSTSLAVTDKEKAGASYQIAVICSEKQARVLKLPSLAAAYSTSLTETSYVLRASVFKFKEDACVLGCYVANGHIMILSVPSLRPLLDCDVLPLTDMRIAKTLQFGAGGIISYFCSPSEVQSMTVSADDAAQLSEMLAVLYIQKQAPEPPKQTFMSMLFGGTSSTTVDREELFGETNSGMTKGTAKQLNASTGAMAGAQDKASGVAGEVRRTQMQLHERGERLGELDMKTEQMMNDSKMYAQSAHQLMMKFQQKKWYQF